MKEKVLYFSLNSIRKKSFYEHIKAVGLCYVPKFSFGLLGEEINFSDPRDLLTIIENEKKRDSLHVIIDYISLAGGGDNYAEVVRDIIMCFPEVQFLFEVTWIEKEKKKDFIYFLFPQEALQQEQQEIRKDIAESVLAEYHQFDLGGFGLDLEKQEFRMLLKGKNNLFDASNLRDSIRRWKFEVELAVTDNYAKLNGSRRCHVALVVDEESHQTLFNAYCLYANGYRVFPVVCATELLWIQSLRNPINPIIRKVALVIRDYDLQFLDVDFVKKDTPGYNEVDFIRGAKKENDSYIVLFPYFGEEKKTGQNEYWRQKDNANTYFVTKGDGDLCIERANRNPMESKEDKLYLRGFKKPLEGIYAWAHQIESVKKIYEATRYKEADKGYKFNTNRVKEKGGHSCPLALYGIVRPMVHRAELYYHFHHYRLAALVAGEAIHILNGFHRSLLIKAYYIQAVAENAMAMSVLGGNENMLVEDVIIRLRKKVKEDVRRMFDERKDQRNVLNNIFNDCHLFCQKKEYFKAADQALSEMAHEREGFGWLFEGRKIFSNSKYKKER